ncbi:MAG TPA: FUSC family protein [bacterium]|nr:FUSC family protein [bacterium]HMW32733.1 FUSC family protein [bacterium]HMW35434.1 FUSC family protein [bacterium]HMY34551.1 FUSC family protein [bacterium]HMZ03320.1 FUSC family protein [bacterium]
MKQKELSKSAEKELSQLTDQELLVEAKKMKSFSINNALFVGFMAGIIIYSVAKNAWGFFTLIPVYFIYKLVNDPKNIRSKVLERLLKERNLK